MTDNERVKELLSKAYAHAKEAYWQFHENANTGAPADKKKAMFHAAQCTSLYAEAAAIYLSAPTLCDEAVPELIQQFHCVTQAAVDTYRRALSDLLQLSIELNCLDELLTGNGYNL